MPPSSMKDRSLRVRVFVSVELNAFPDVVLFAQFQAEWGTARQYKTKDCRFLSSLNR